MTLYVIPLAINYLSWAMLALGLPRGYQQHYGTCPGIARTRLLRLGGWALALLALGLDVHWLGWGQGSVAWASIWMLAAMAWVLLQAWQPRASRWLAPLLLLLAIAGSLLA
jgi:hypothetical protein